MAYQTLKGIKMTCNQVDLTEKEYNDDWKKTTSKWKCILRYEGKQLTTPFYMGSALTGEPEKTDVMYSLINDALSGDYTFEQFAHEYGYNTDSREAERIFRQCKRTHQSLERVFGEQHIQAMAEELQDY